MTDPEPADSGTEPRSAEGGTEPRSAVGSAEAGPVPDTTGVPTRRLVRWAIVLLAMVLGVVVCWHDNAYAHDNVVLTLHTDGRGSVWADVTWEDGHPVSESIAAAITANSQAGTQIGPAAMTALPGSGAVRYSGTLAPGHWRVVVEAASPGTGTCTADFEIGKAATAQTVKCDKRPAAVAQPAPAKTGSGSRTFIFVAVGIGIVLAAGLALLMARQRFPSPR